MSMASNSASHTKGETEMDKVSNDFNVMFFNEFGEVYDFQETGLGPFATLEEAEACAKKLMARDYGFTSYRIGSMKEYVA